MRLTPEEIEALHVIRKRNGAPDLTEEDVQEWLEYWSPEEIDQLQKVIAKELGSE